MTDEKTTEPDTLALSSLSDFLKGIEMEYDAYEGMLYAIVLFSSASGGFIDLDSSMDYFDFVCGSIRKERVGSTSTLKFWDLDVPQKGRMVQKDKILMYNSDGIIIGLTDPKKILNKATISTLLLLTKNAIAQLSKVTSLKDSHYRDALTGVHNRLAFEKDITHAILFKERFNKPVFLMYIDVNSFKSVNDKLGHQVGDRVLKSICHEIQKCTMNLGHLYRVGGDEFCVIFKGVDKKKCDEVSEEIHQIASQAPGGIIVDCSVGISEYTGQPIEEFIQSADNQMYCQKNEKKNHCQEQVQTSNTAIPSDNEHESKADFLVDYFHERANITDPPNSTELKQASCLIQQYDSIKAQFITNYALRKLKESKTQAKVFGIVLRFEKEAVKHWEENDKRER